MFKAVPRFHNALGEYKPKFTTFTEDCYSTELVSLTDADYKDPMKYLFSTTAMFNVGTSITEGFYVPLMVPYLGHIYDLFCQHEVCTPDYVISVPAFWEDLLHTPNRYFPFPEQFTPAQLHAKLRFLLASNDQLRFTYIKAVEYAFVKEVVLPASLAIHNGSVTNFAALTAA